MSKTKLKWSFRDRSRDFNEVRELLEFAVGMREAGFRSDGADQMILRNILESLHNVTEAARNAGMEEMRRTINFVTENAHRLLIRRAIDRAQFSEAIGMPRASGRCAMRWSAAGRRRSRRNREQKS
jgi:hypothetical protein